VDLLVSPPRTWGERLRASLVSWLIKEVDLFICYFKDTSLLQRTYRIEAERVVYVPFKVNDYERVLAAPIRDDGFVLVAGRTQRDYPLLFEAVKELPYPVVVLEYRAPDWKVHTGRVKEKRIPNNVQIIGHDGAQDSWLDWLSRSRLLLLPIRAESITPSGISTYLQAMALGKCVVMTRGPATNGLIDKGEAVLVTPGDPIALRNALRRVYEDDQVRQAIAAKGRSYALRLGEHNRLATDIVQLVTTHLRSTRVEAVAG
jgi:glycosyltransferase involved in cell wall biosynthesis